MNKFHKELERQAESLTNLDFLDCKLRVNRRNGYYAIDKYNLEDDKFRGPAFCGTYKECEIILKGMYLSYILTRPF